ncbi:MAG TPA: phage tail assembly chaperone [Sphingomicrobium sp.]|nr:phage tail assembly chaperone [Sphingomicrobium sp.]
MESSFDGPPPRRSFGEQASKLAGIAARLLGWRPDEFWRATPAELASAFHEEEFEPVAGEELERLMERFPDG